LKCQSYDIKIELESFIDRLRESGHRITKQRTVVVRQILKFGRPFSLEDLSKKVSKIGIDHVTVYRSLLTFKSLGILTTVDFDDGPQLYLEFTCF